MSLSIELHFGLLETFGRVGYGAPQAATLSGRGNLVHSRKHQNRKLYPHIFKYGARQGILRKRSWDKKIHFVRLAKNSQRSDFFFVVFDLF